MGFHFDIGAGIDGAWLFALRCAEGGEVVTVGESEVIISVSTGKGVAFISAGEVNLCWSKQTIGEISMLTALVRHPAHKAAPLDCRATGVVVASYITIEEAVLKINNSLADFSQKSSCGNIVARIRGIGLKVNTGTAVGNVVGTLCSARNAANIFASLVLNKAGYMQILDGGAVNIAEW